MTTTKPPHHAFILAIALAASACSVSVPRLALAPPGVRVRPEVAAGYAAYGARLSAWGTWGPDREYGVRWCPTEDATGGPDVPFQPYLSRGHWDVAAAPGDGAEGGRPVWRSEDSDTWGEITTHHGWWIRPAGHPTSWCWIPGAEETPGHVVWRDGDGFVGWAPEPPDAVAAVDEADYDDSFDWVYTLLGTLTSDHTDQDTLTGAARDRAQAATTPGRKANGSLQRRTAAPSGNSIAAAHHALGQYAAQHPDALAASAALHPALAAAGPSGSSGKSKSSKSSAKVKESSEKEGVTVTAGVAPAPPPPYAMTYYDALMMQPPTGVAGPVPQVHGATGSTGASATGATGATGRGGTGSAASAMTSGTRARSGGAAHTASPSHSPAARSSGHTSSRSSGRSGRSSRSRSHR